MTFHRRLWLLVLAIILVVSGVSYGADFTADCQGLTDTGLSGVSINVVRLANVTYRAYYMGGTQGLTAAKSSDGVSWASEQGFKLSSTDGSQIVSNPWVFLTKDNRYRMIYEVQDSSKNRRLYSAISTDGLTFTGEGIVMSGTSEDINPQSNTVFLSVPTGIRLPDGTLRMYFVSDGSDTRSAVSNDEGRTWTKDSGTRILNAVDPAIFTRLDGSYGFLYTDWTQQYRVKRVLYATSSDGLSFTTTSTPIINVSANSSVVDPEVVATADGRLRLYFTVGSEDLSTSNIYTCLLPSSYQGDNCAASLSSDLVLHVPVITYNGASYWAHLVYMPAQDGSIGFRLTDGGLLTYTTPYKDCTSSSLSKDLTLDIPSIVFGNTTLWAKMAWQQGNEVSFKVLQYGAE